jgi:capsular polysaccharide biosynthesis protein
MIHRDDPSHTPDPHHALVGEPQHPGDALMVQSNGAPQMPLIMSGGPMPPAHDVLRGGMDANSFLNALRRRWILALGMGLIAGIGTAIALWFIFPESSSATALFEVRNKQESIVREGNQSTVQDFEILKKTQLAVLRSKFLLTAALRNPSVAALSILADESDKEEWLQENLEVEFPQNGELLAISLTGTPPEDLETLVNAVAEAYDREVISREKQRKLTIKDMLERSLQNLNADIKRKFEDYLDLAKSLGRPQGESDRDPELELLLRDVADSQKKIEDMTAAIIQLQTDFAVARNELSDPALFELQAEEELKRDQKYLYLQYQLDQLALMSMTTPGGSKGSVHGSSSNTQLAQAQNLVDQYSKQFKRDYVRNLQNKPNVPLQQLGLRYRTQGGSMKQQLDMQTKALEQKKRIWRTD